MLVKTFFSIVTAFGQICALVLTLMWAWQAFIVNWSELWLWMILFGGLIAAVQKTVDYAYQRSHWPRVRRLRTRWRWILRKLTKIPEENRKYI